MRMGLLWWGDGLVKEVSLDLVVSRGSVLFRDVLEVLNVREQSLDTKGIK